MTERTRGTCSALDTGTQSYIRQIQLYPYLGAEEELSLARRWREHGDQAAEQLLVNSYLRLVVKMAMQYRRYPVPIEDLISEGTLGLIQAVERFDPERGYRLSTYAMWWIRAAITEVVIRSWSLVKTGTTSEQKKLFFNLRRMKARLNAYEDGDLSEAHIQRIATELKVPEADVVMMNRRLAGLDATLNAPMREEGEGEWQDSLLDDSQNQGERFEQFQEQGYRRRIIREVMGGLSEREREIVADRHLRDEPVTLEKLGKRYGISRERVRQIEVAAVAKIKRWVEQNERGLALTEAEIRPRITSSNVAAAQ